MCFGGLAPFITLLYKDIIKFRYGQVIIKNHIKYYPFVIDFISFPLKSHRKLINLQSETE